MTTTPIDHLAEKARSYRNRIAPRTRTVVRTLRPIPAVRYRDLNTFEIESRMVIPAGTILTITTGDSNAGFRGIEFYAKHDGHTAIASTGAIEIL